MYNKLLFLLIGLGLSFQTFGQDVKKDFKTSSISIFKNGTAFFIKSGKVNTENSVYQMKKNIPPALSGTYWITSPAGELNFLSTYMDTLKTQKEVVANSIVDMLNANLGKKVRLHIGKEEVIEGTVQDVGIKQADQAAAARYNIVSFRMDGQWMTLLSNEIRRVEFFEQPNQLLEQKNQEVKPILEVNFSSAKKEQALDMMYLSKGLNWTPIYLIELTGEEKARLTLRAEVVNNIEDIENTDVNFVVGVPNFSYADDYSALIDLAVPELFQARSAGSFANLSNRAQTQSIGYILAQDIEFATPPAATSGLQGSAEEDLYFYTMKNMSLKKGGRGHYPVFTADINIAHIYECNLPQNNAQKNYYQSDYLFTPNPNKVFHSIKVVNDTPYPFTTGPALVVKKETETKPISQDRLNYTSVNGNSFVKLTEAPDVHIKQAEKATKREERVKKLTKNKTDYYYDLITVEGQVKAKNYKDKKIDLNIRRAIIGELKKSSTKWLKAERINTSGNLNKTTDVCWETSVKAGEELTITYSYQIYVPH